MFLEAIPTKLQNLKNFYQRKLEKLQRKNGKKKTTQTIYFELYFELVVTMAKHILI